MCHIKHIFNHSHLGFLYIYYYYRFLSLKYPTLNAPNNKNPANTSEVLEVLSKAGSDSISSFCEF